MQLPSFLYGTYKDVKARSSKLVSALRRSAKWNELTELSGEMLDTRRVSGLIVIDGPSPLLGGEQHFNCFAPLRTVYMAVPKRLPWEIEQEVFDASLQTPWGVLGLLGQTAQNVAWREHNHVPFLRAVARFWDEFDAEGPRYTAGSRTPKRLWSLPTTIQHVLAVAGMPESIYRGQSPPDFNEVLARLQH